MKTPNAMQTFFLFGRYLLKCIKKIGGTPILNEIQNDVPPSLVICYNGLFLLEKRKSFSCMNKVNESNVVNQCTTCRYR